MNKQGKHMIDQKYTLIINKSEQEGFEQRVLEKKDFLRETSMLLKEPARIFLGLGDFLEVGDYNNLLDSLFFTEEGVQVENILDKNNRKISEEGSIPYSFFKLAVYYPDYLLKEVPVSCVSMIGKKARLFPGAETFVKYIKDYDPIVLSAMPYEIAQEFAERLNLEGKNLISSQYKIKKNENHIDVYAGDIIRFVSGDRKSIEIEKYMNELDLKEEEVVYIGRGEAGVKTFSSVNSVAFNPSKSIIPESRITLYGSSLISLLVLFNFGGALERFLSSEAMDEYMPSLIVYSDTRSKSDELIDIELHHRLLQDNIIGQRIEYSGESYDSVQREVEIALGGSSFDMKKIRDLIAKRMGRYKNNQHIFIKEIYEISKERYNNYFRQTKK